MKSDPAALWSSGLWTVDCGGEQLCQENTLREGERERESIGGAGRIGQGRLTE